LDYSMEGCGSLEGGQKRKQDLVCGASSPKYVSYIGNIVYFYFFKERREKLNQAIITTELCTGFFWFCS